MSEWCFAVSTTTKDPSLPCVLATVDSPRSTSRELQRHCDLTSHAWRGVWVIAPSRRPCAVPNRTRCLVATRREEGAAFVPTHTQSFTPPPPTTPLHTPSHPSRNAVLICKPSAATVICCTSTRDVSSSFLYLHVGRADRPSEVTARCPDVAPEWPSDNALASKHEYNLSRGEWPSPYRLQKLAPSSCQEALDPVHRNPQPFFAT